MRSTLPDQCPLSGARRTSLTAFPMSANDPKRTLPTPEPRNCLDCQPKPQELRLVVEMSEELCQKKGSRLAAKQATVNLFAGFPSASTALLDVNALHYNEINLTGSQNATPPSTLCRSIMRSTSDVVNV